MTQWRLPDDSPAERFDLAAARHLGLTRSAVLRLIKTGAGRIDGKIARAGEIVHGGTRLTLDLDVVSNDVTEIAPRASVKLTEYYRDDDVVIVEKPAGLMVHPGNGRSHEPSVVDYARLISSDPDPDRPGIVHRLDRETSGLLVIARTAEAKIVLQRQWQQRDVIKSYLLLVVGHLDELEATIDLPLGRDPAKPLRQAVRPGGRSSQTSYRVLQEYPGYSLVEAWPKTGRTHQLRVHFAVTGHPIAGDIVYGPSKRPLQLTRQFLHAASLSLVLPSGTRRSFISPLPPDLQATLNQLDSHL